MELDQGHRARAVAPDDIETFPRLNSSESAPPAADDRQKPCSLGDDSAYTTGPGSVCSVSSPADDESDVESAKSDDPHPTRNGVFEAPEANSTMTSSLADRGCILRKKASCPALSAATGSPFPSDVGFPRLALSDDESGGGKQPKSNNISSIVIPHNATMIPATGSNRRRLGQRRSIATGNDDTNANRSVEDLRQRVANDDATSDVVKTSVTTFVETGSNGDTTSNVRPLERKPSSLFYLNYIAEEDEDEEQRGYRAFSYRSRLHLSELSSSRKLSAASYAPRLAYYVTGEDDEDEDELSGTNENEMSDHRPIVKITPGKTRLRVIEDYEDNLRQIDAITKPFRLADDVYQKIKVVLNNEMDRGLRRSTHDEATVKMFHTHVRSLPDGSETGRYLALDLGGTNFRVLLVNLNGRRHPDVVSKVYLIPLRIMLGSGDQLFDHIAKCIAEFLDEQGLKDEQFPLGFTFSFPCIQEGLASARLARWTKGFKCSGVENEDVVRLLHEAIARRGDLRVQCITIINDNVGVLMAGAHRDTKCRVGLIIGTGCNCCYLEDLDKVELWEGEFKEPRKMVINTEWGAFGDDGALSFVLNPFDRRLDVMSINPGNQLFEKMISGMYMGEIVRLVLCDLILRGLIFRGFECDELFQPQRFYTKYISEIESDDPAGDFPSTRIVLEELLKSNAWSSRDDCHYVQHVCWQVSQRAAFLAATAVAVVIDRLNLDDVTVAVDGSLYRFHPHFKDLMNTKIAQLVGPNQKFRLILADDGSGQGAALVAAIADQRNHGNKVENSVSTSKNNVIEIY